MKKLLIAVVVASSFSFASAEPSIPGDWKPFNYVSRAVTGSWLDYSHVERPQIIGEKTNFRVGFFYHEFTPGIKTSSGKDLHHMLRMAMVDCDKPQMSPIVEALYGPDDKKPIETQAHKADQVYTVGSNTMAAGERDAICAVPDELLLPGKTVIPQ